MEFKVVTVQEFKIGLAAIEKNKLDEDRQQVVARIKETLGFIDMGFAEGTEVYFKGYEGLTTHALMSMTKRNGTWFIDDLISVTRGYGGRLAEFGINHAKADYGDLQRKKISLISLTETSTAFWEGIGFKISSNVNSRKSVPMDLALGDPV